MSHVSYCDEERRISKPSTLETGVSSCTESVNEGHPDKICDQFSDVVFDAFLICDTKCKVPGVRVVAETAEIPHLLSDVEGVVKNIGIDSFIDDLSSVGSQGSNRHDCVVLYHVGKQSGSIQPHQDSNQQHPTRQMTREERRREGKRG